MLNKIFGWIHHFVPENNRFERIWKIAQVDFKRRYYNDRLGILWALLNPIFQMLIYYFVFTVVRNRTEDNFALFIFAGLIVWMSFAEATSKGINIIKQKKYLIENIQLNKVDLFVSSVLSVFMGLSFNLVVYVIVSLFFGVYFGWNAFYFVILYINVFILCIASSMILSTVTGFLKDIHHLWNLTILAGFFGSGIFYSGQLIIDAWSPMMYINPFLGIIINSRNALLYNLQPDFYLLAVNIIFSIVLLLIGYQFFKRYSYLTLEKL